jgi:hypothetical protein
MHSMILIILSDFMQALNINRKHYTKNEYFPNHIIFTTIYLLQKKLNLRIFFEKEINMDNFVQSTENDVNMYEKFRGLAFYGFL